MERIGWQRNYKLTSYHTRTDVNFSDLISWTLEVYFGSKHPENANDKDNYEKHCEVVIIANPAPAFYLGGTDCGLGSFGSTRRVKIRPPEPVRHEYEVDEDTACSADDVFDSYLRWRSAPGANEVPEGVTSREFELTLVNWILQTIDYNNCVIRNETIPGRHSFHPGSIIIKISARKSGSNISILGEGDGRLELLNRAAFKLFFQGEALSAKAQCAIFG